MQTFSVTAFEPLMERFIQNLFGRNYWRLIFATRFEKSKFSETNEGSNKLTFKNLQSI